MNSFLRPDRRRFLAAVPLAGSVALSRGFAEPDEAAPETAPPRDDDAPRYVETAHVRAYYARARG
jgi:hypothetical protein